MGAALEKWKSALVTDQYNYSVCIVKCQRAEDEMLASAQYMQLAVIYLLGEETAGNSKFSQLRQVSCHSVSVFFSVVHFGSSVLH